VATKAGAELLEQVRDKRRQVEALVAAAVPRKRRLLNLSIIGGALAAILTTGPALGGQSFASWLRGVFDLTTPAWQLLCAGAAVSSLVATVATQLLKSHRLEERVFRGYSARAKLEALEVGLTTGRLDPSRATEDYLKCVEEVAYLEGQG
jgi:MFS family permease